MTRLIAALWTVDTKRFASTPDARMGELATAVEIAWLRMTALGGGASKKTPSDKSFHRAEESDCRYLFVAPEYLFTAKNSHFMPEGAQEMIRAQLVFLSLRFADLLLIPGSIGWFKTSVRSAERIFRKQHAKPQRRDMNKYRDRIADFANQQFDYGFAGDGQKKIYDEGLDALKYMQAQEMKKHGTSLEKGDAKIRIAKNTCFALQSAQIVHRYDKFFEAWDSTDKDLSIDDLKKPTLFMPGRHSPTFERAQISYGLELCADHNAAALRLYTTKIKQAEVDIQVVMSASTSLEDSHCIARRFILQADAGGAGVRTRDSDALVKPDSEANSLAIYDLKW